MSLVELLSSLVIGLLLLSSLLGICLGFKNQYVWMHENAALQENARFANLILNEAISQAGFLGCRRLTPRLNVIDLGVSSERLLTYGRQTLIFNVSLASSFGAFAALTSQKAKVGSDLILVRYMSFKTAPLLKVAGENSLFTTLFIKFQAGDDIVIASCLHVVLAHIKDVYQEGQDQRLVLSRPLPFQFEPEMTQIGQLVTQVFYVNKANTLCEATPFESSKSLIDDVYGLKANLLNFGQRNGIDIHLLLASHKSVFNAPSFYQFDGIRYQNKSHKLFKTINLLIPIGE